MKRSTSGFGVRRSKVKVTRRSEGEKNHLRLSTPSGRWRRTKSCLFKVTNYCIVYNRAEQMTYGLSVCFVTQSLNPSVCVARSLMIDCNVQYNMQSASTLQWLILLAATYKNNSAYETWT